MMDHVSKRARPARGNPYSIDEFQATYGLEYDVAENLFERFAPSSVELDLLMAAKRRKPVFEAVASDMNV